MNPELDRLVHEALSHYENTLHERIEAGRVNAWLTSGDPSLILPAPSVTLLQVESDRSLELDDTCRFRALGEGATGEVVFLPVARRTAVQPWRVMEANWRDASGAARAAGRGLRELQVQLVRDEDAVAAAGWLSLSIEGPAMLEFVLDRAWAACGDRRVPLRSWTRALSADGAANPPIPWPTLSALEAMTTTLVQVHLDRDHSAARALQLRIGFRHPLGADAPPAVFANAVPAWNSVPCRYPDAADPEQHVSESRQRLVHPLAAPDPHSPWRAWRVLSVYPASGARDIPQRADRVQRAGDEVEFHLAFVPVAAGTKSEPSASPRAGEAWQLAVVLTPAARRWLDRSRGRLSAEYLATTGTAGNDVARGVRFELLPADGRLVPAALRTTSLCASWGGADGWAPFIDARALGLQGPLPMQETRTIGRLVEGFRARFGSELEIVDVADLVRRPSRRGVAPLALRLRVIRPERLPAERRALLRAARHFLARAAARLEGRHAEPDFLVREVT